MSIVPDSSAIEDAIHRPTGPVPAVMAEASEVPLTVPDPSEKPVLFVVTVTVALWLDESPVTVSDRLEPDAAPKLTSPPDTVALYV